MTLTDAELSRWIAEKLEPKPDIDDLGYGGYFDVHGQWQDTSTKKAWLRQNAQEWQPRDMIHDPAMTVLLLENLQYQFTTLIIHRNYIRAEMMVEQYYEGRGELGRAVAEA